MVSIRTKDESLALKFIKFWQTRWAVIIKDYKYVVNDIYKIKNYENIFFSINGYKKNTKKRDETNIKSFNAFFFDIDLKDNENLTKDEIKANIMQYKDDFAFIIESRNGFHLHILIDSKNYLNNNWTINKNNYINDWKIKVEYYENVLWLNIDSNAIKTTQIARIPGTIHNKPGQTTFKIKLLKWENLLEKNIYDFINEVKITDVLDKLKINYDKNDFSIFEWPNKTNWRKINPKWNFIIDFSNKNRPKWEPFAFVKNYFKIMNSLNDMDSIIKTFTFFENNFWIIWKAKKEKNIKINKFLNINLLWNNLSSQNLKYFLYFQYFATKNNINDWERSNEIKISEMIDFIWKENVCKKTLLKNIDSLSKNNILDTKTNESTILKNFKIIDFKIDTKSLKFCILPNFNSLKNNIFNSKFYHFLNKNILDLNPNNNNIIDFYLYLNKKLILDKKEEIVVKNKEIDSFKINAWFWRYSVLKDFCKKIWIFSVEKSKKDWYIFRYLKAIV